MWRMYPCTESFLCRCPLWSVGATAAAPKWPSMSLLWCICIPCLAQWHCVPCQVPAKRGGLVVVRGRRRVCVLFIRLLILSEVYQLVFCWCELGPVLHCPSFGHYCNGRLMRVWHLRCAVGLNGNNRSMGWAKNPCKIYTLATVQLPGIPQVTAEES